MIESLKSSGGGGQHNHLLPQRSEFKSFLIPVLKCYSKIPGTYFQSRRIFREPLTRLQFSNWVRTICPSGWLWSSPPSRASEPSSPGYWSRKLSSFRHILDLADVASIPARPARTWSIRSWYLRHVKGLLIVTLFASFRLYIESPFKKARLFLTILLNKYKDHLHEYVTFCCPGYPRRILTCVQ